MESLTPDVHLLERMLSRENRQRAWKRVKANKATPGIDNLSIEKFPKFARHSWDPIRKSLLAGTYQPRHVQRVQIPKRTGGTRPLGIPTGLDRLIQQAIAQVLGPIFDPGFSDSSYGFRPGRSAHEAVRKVREHIRKGYHIAVDLDLSKFFDTVNHDLPMPKVAMRVRDKRVLRPLGKYLRAGAVVSGRLQHTPEGVPQGGPPSPLLANILLDGLDKEREKRGPKFVRYADDFLILVKSLRAGERVRKSVQHFLDRKLKLKVQPEQKPGGSTQADRLPRFHLPGRHDPMVG